MTWTPKARCSRSSYPSRNSSAPLAGVVLRGGAGPSMQRRGTRQPHEVCRRCPPCDRCSCCTARRATRVCTSRTTYPARGSICGHGLLLGHGRMGQGPCRLHRLLLAQPASPDTYPWIRSGSGVERHQRCTAYTCASGRPPSLNGCGTRRRSATDHSLDTAYVRGHPCGQRFDALSAAGGLHRVDVGRSDRDIVRRVAARRWNTRRRCTVQYQQLRIA